MPLRGGRFALAERSSAANRRPPRWQGDAGVDFIEEFRLNRSNRVVLINSGGRWWGRDLLVRPPQRGRTSVTSPPEPQVRRRIPTRGRSITHAPATGSERHRAAYRGNGDGRRHPRGTHLAPSTPLWALGLLSPRHLKYKRAEECSTPPIHTATVQPLSGWPHAHPPIQLGIGASRNFKPRFRQCPIREILLHRVQTRPSGAFWMSNTTWPWWSKGPQISRISRKIIWSLLAVITI